jgi:SET domain-containing protein
MLNEELFFTKNSNISGKGNFAKMFIKKGTNLGVGLIKINNTNNPDIDYLRKDICTYTNHSETPNIYFKKKGNKYYFYALKNIEKNEELIIDYHKFDFEGKRDF